MTDPVDLTQRPTGNPGDTWKDRAKVINLGAQFHPAEAAESGSLPLMTLPGTGASAFLYLDPSRKCLTVNVEITGGEAVPDWLLDDDGLARINVYMHGEVLFEYGPIDPLN